VISELKRYQSVMKRVVPALVLSFGLCAHGALADSPASGAPPETPHRIVLLVDEIKAIRSFPVVLAERLGYLKSTDTEVTVMNIRDDVSAADLLADGRVDAVMAYYHHTIVGQSEGQSLEAIVTLGITPGVKVMVANQAKGKFKSLADLKGSRIITGGGGSSKTTIANYLVLAGGHRINDYTRLGTDGKDANVEALRNGSADFVVAPTPDGSFYESQGVATVFADLTSVQGTKQYLGSEFPSSAVYMTHDRVKAHPEIAQFLAVAFVRTLSYINTHSPEEVAAVIPDAISGKDRAAYLKILKEEIPMFATDGRMPAAAAEKEWHVLSEFNPKLGTIDLQQTFTNEFVEEALRRRP
jgi:NitT/TauT family transport system substrate-binding protein